MSLKELYDKLAEHNENYENWWGWQEGYTHEEKADFLECAYFEMDDLLMDAIKLLEEREK